MNSRTEFRRGALLGRIFFAAAVLSIAVGSMVFLGWLLDLPWLQSFASDGTSMKANAAVCFILCGVACWLLQHPDPAPAPRMASRVLAGLVAGIAILTLGEYLFSWNSGLDEFLFRDDAPAPPGPHSGRLPPNAAVCFLAFGLALLASASAKSKPHRQVIVKSLAATVALVGLISLLGHVVNVAGGYQWWGFNPIPFHGAGLFLALGVGLYASSLREDEFIWVLDQPQAFATIAMISLLGLVGGMAFRSLRQATEATQSEVDAIEVRFHNSRLFSLVQDVEADSHGYLSSGLESFLQSYRAATNAIPVEFARMGELTGKNPVQQNSLTALAPLIAARIHLADQAMALRREHSPEAVAAGSHNGEARALMEEIRQKVARFDRKAARMAQNRMESATSRIRDEYLLRQLGMLLTLAMLIAVLVNLTDSLHKRKQAEATLRESEARLNFALETNQTGAWDLNLLDHTVQRTLIHDRIFGYEHLLPVWSFERLLEHVLPEDRPAVEKSLQAALAAQSDWSFECRIRRADGAERWISARSGPARNADGQTVRMSGLVQDITERKQAAETLQLNEDRFRSLVTATSQIVWSTRANGKVDDMPAWRHYTGQTVEEVHGDRWTEALHPDDRARVIAVWQRAVETGSLYEIEYRLRRQDGQYGCFLSRGVPVLGADGRIREWIGSCADIHERKQVEEVLQISAAYTRSLLETSLDPLVTISAEGKITDVNDASVQVTGLTREQLLGTDFSDYFTEPAKAREGYQRVFAEGLVRDYPLAFRHVSGRVTEVLYNASVYRDPQGQVAGVFAAARDITERIRAEQKIHELNANLERRVQERTADLKREVAERTRVQEDLSHQYAILQSINRIFEEALTSHTEEALGRLCLNITNAVTSSEQSFIGEIGGDGLLQVMALSGTGGAPDRPADADGKRRTLGGIKIHGLNARVIQNGESIISNDPAAGRDEFGLPAGHPPLTAVLAVPLCRNRRVVGMIAVTNRAGGYGPPDLKSLEALASAIVEVIARKRAEDAVRRLNHRLQRRATQLAATNQELEAFAYSVSHDLRAPLRAIDGFSRVLQEDYEHQLNAAGQDSLQRVRAASQRMGQLIDDLLKLSRLTREPMQAGPVNLSTLARAVGRELARATPQRAVELVVAPEVTLQGDERLLRIVLENLMGNAWKFTSRQPAARIEFGCVEIDGAQGCFVRDNGAGFDMAYAHKLFGAFQRLHATSEFPGSGIGLATVQRIVHRHGGRIWAAAEVGRGATFYFTLPAAESANSGEPASGDKFHENQNHDPEPDAQKIA